MKLALLSYEYPPDTGFGGIGTYTWYQARALVKLGHEVHVLAGALNHGEQKIQELDGVRVYRYRVGNPWQWGLKPLNALRLWWAKGRIENALSMFRLFKKLAKEHHYDLIEMPECGAEGLLLNGRINSPTLIKFHSPAQLIGDFSRLSKTEMRFCAGLEQTAIRRATALSACSQFLKTEVINKMNVQKTIRVIPNGIDLDLFDAADQIDFRQKFVLPKDRLMLLFAGRMERRKGIHLCPETAAEVLKKYDVSFVFAGADPDRFINKALLPYLEKKPLKGSIHYLGKLNMLDMRSAMRQSDIFLIPSLWENCPYSCLEAMAAGRAVVASDCGGLPEIIQNNQNGLLAINNDTKSYIAKLENIIEDEALRKQLGQAARSTIENQFTDIHIARQSLKHYEKCVNEYE